MAKKEKKTKNSNKKDTSLVAKKRKNQAGDLREKLAAKMGKQEEGTRYIVRIANKDLDGSLTISRALLGIAGISHRFAGIIATTFEKKTGIKASEKLGKIEEKHDAILEEIIMNPEKNGIPEWMLNKRKDYSTGENKHLVMGDLQFGLRNDLKRLNEIKSYRGLRHSWGLTVRGQKTKSTHRGKGSVVGVMKKEK